MNLHNHTLEDWQADYLYRNHPGLGRDPRVYCPTCLKKGTYEWPQGVTNMCDCFAQLNLHKHYLWAGIGTDFQRMTYEDYHGDSDALRIAQRYVAEDLARRGTGMIFMGKYGLGKTMLANLMLKDLVRQGLSCYATTFDTMIEAYTGSWKSDEEREVFDARVRRSQVLLLDDFGKTVRSSESGRNFHEATFDEIVRPRVHGGQATIFTTNMEEPDIEQVYGSGILSLLRRNVITYTFTGEDYGPVATSRMNDEWLAGLIRPIS